MFDKGVALCRMASGPVTLGNELSFGYNGADFCILHRRGGLSEIRTLTITSAATGNETATITLAGVEFTTDLTNTTAAGNAHEIEADKIAGDYAGWNVSQVGDTVVFSAQSVCPVNDDFTFSSATATGTFTQNEAGLAVTDTFVDQTEWNIDKCDGEGPSGWTFDPQKLNVFEVSHAYLGSGDIIYSIYNPNRREFMAVHTIEYAGTSTMTNSSQPAFKIGWFAASLGSTTDLNIYGASAMAAVDGQVLALRNSDGHANEKTGVGTTLTNILSIRIRDVFSDVINLVEVAPIEISASTDGTKNAVIEVLLNPTLGGVTNWTYHDENNDVIEYDTAGTTITKTSDTSEIVQFEMARVDQLIQALEHYNMRLSRGDILTIAARTTSGTSDIGASIAWLEN
jgi:hypothetical protein